MLSSDGWKLSEGKIRRCAASGTRTRTAVTGQGILSPSCLPFHHHGKPSAKLTTIIETRKRFLLFFSLWPLRTPDLSSLASINF